MPSQWLPLPITGPPHQNLSTEQSLDVRSAQVVDAYVDEAGYTVKRPGLLPFVDLGTARGIDGLYWWDEEERMIAVSNSSIFFVNDSSGNVTTGTAGMADLPVGNRVSFASTPEGFEVLLAAGARVVITTPTNASVGADPDQPTTVRSLAAYDQYTIAPIEGTGTFAFDEVASGGLGWRAQDIASAEARPDRIVAVLGTLDGFILFGKTTTEFWVNDGVSPFTRVRGLTFDRGCGARYSPALLGDTWLWLDNRRFVVRSTVNKIETVSDAIEKELQSLSWVEDAIGDMMTVMGRQVYVLTFPIANRTFVYDLKQNTWTEWGQWDSSVGAYLRFRGNAYAYSSKWNLHVVGDKSNGKLYTLDNETFQDNGETLRSVRRTGFITHGTSNRKRCHKLRFRLKRSVANGSVASPVMSVKWRETGGAWGVSHPVSLGEVGEHELFVTLHQCGSYRARQYEFSHSDATGWVLMGGDELVEVYER